jgi:hypothetical protein
MARRITLAAVIVLAALGVLAFSFWHGLAHFLGLDTQQSPFYNFHSGPGPELIALLGFSSLLAGLWHHLNCHADGCWRIKRHTVNGTPWCNVHHCDARPQRGESELLEEISARLEHISNKLDQM